MHRNTIATSLLALPFAAILTACGGKVSTDGSAPAAATAGVKPVRMEIVSIYTKALPGMGSTMPWIAEQAGAISGDNLKLIVKEPGESIPGKAILEAVSAGKVDGGYGASGFGLAKFPLRHSSPLCHLAQKRQNIWPGCTTATA